MDRITEYPTSDPSRAAELRILSMTPDGQAGASIQSILRRRMDEIAQAIRDKNVDHLMTFYASDVEVFDLRFSLAARSRWRRPLLVRRLAAPPYRPQCFHPLACAASGSRATSRSS